MSEKKISQVKKVINYIIGLLALTALVLVVIYVVLPFFEKPGLQVTKDEPKQLVEPAKNGRKNTTSQPEENQPFSFVILSDSNSGAGNVSQSATFTNIVKEISESDDKPDFLIHAGDMIAGSGSTSLSLADKMWESFGAAIEPLEKNNIAFFPSAGNHDASFNKLLPQAYRTFWDKNKNTQDIKIDGSYSSYYSFDYQGSHFIVLYSPKTYLDEEQLKWLEQNIDNAQGQYDNIFVISHIPLTAVSTYHPNDQLTPGSRLKEILAGKITAFFGAHHNLYYDFEADDIRQIGTGRVGSGGIYQFKSRYGTGAQNYNSYLRVEVKGNDWEVEQVRSN
ncbi:metallophosphoesterase [Patescibacteria group bacterium]|nr:metallophosphoesterase [Patescibacteria group bacterium]